MYDALAKLGKTPDDSAFNDHDGNSSDERVQIQVTGDTAIATTSRGKSVYFRKEGGNWTFCMSDDPKLADVKRKLLGTN
jgi:hypothetical protein